MLSDAPISALFVSILSFVLYLQTLTGVLEAQLPDTHYNV